MNKMKLLGIPALRAGDIKDPSSPQVWAKVATCLHGSGGELCPGISEEIGVQSTGRCEGVSSL